MKDNKSQTNLKEKERIKEQMEERRKEDGKK